MVGIDPSHVTIDEETDGWSAKGQITPPSTPEMKSYRDNHVMIEKELWKIKYIFLCILFVFLLCSYFI